MSFRRSDLKTIVADVVSSVTSINSKHVYKARQKIETTGPNVVITIPDSDEEGVTMPRPLGRREVEYTVKLSVFVIDTVKNVEKGDAAFEGVVDDIIEAIRANPQPDDRILAFGTQRIRSRIEDPRFTDDKESNIFRGANIVFPVVVHVVG
jgi:hypothetical protein